MKSTRTDASPPPWADGRGLLPVTVLTLDNDTSFKADFKPIVRVEAAWLADSGQVFTKHRQMFGEGINHAVWKTRAGRGFWLLGNSSDGNLFEVHLGDTVADELEHCIGCASWIPKKASCPFCVTT